MDSLIKFRVATEDRVRLETAASDADKTLSEWARDTLLAVCSGELAAPILDQKIINVTPQPEGSAKVAKQRLFAGRPDPDKIAAFQRKAGMDIFDAKKRKAR